MCTLGKCLHQICVKFTRWDFSRCVYLLYDVTYTFSVQCENIGFGLFEYIRCDIFCVLTIFQCIDLQPESEKIVEFIFLAGWKMVMFS